MKRLFVIISIFCSFTIRRFLFRFVLSFKLFDYPSELYLNLVPVEKSSPEWYDPLDSQMKFPRKAERGIPPKEPPTQSQTYSVSQNQSRTLSSTQSLNLSQNLSQKDFLRPFPLTAQIIYAGIHRKGESLQKDQIVQDFDSVEEYHSSQ